MNKNVLLVIVVVLLIACVGEGFWVLRERNEKILLGAMLVKQQQSAMTPKPSTGARPQPLMKGQVFTDNPLSSKAYLIAPVTGDLSADAQKALTGWTVKTTDNGDGTTQITLIPKEAEDVQQTFTLKPGFKLYFIEMTLVDDATGVDKNRGDDIGVLVDDKGIVQ